MTDPRPDPQPSLSDELARERSREAADRTLLAWIRTSLAMISLGFGIERLGQVSMGGNGLTRGSVGMSTRLFGAALVALGVAATLAGMWEHRAVLRGIASPGYRYAERLPIARSMGMALVLMGTVALALILAGG